MKCPLGYFGENMDVDPVSAALAAVREARSFTCIGSAN